MDMQAEYDNGAKVPGYQAIVAGWTEASAAMRASWPERELDVPYGPTDRQKLDVFWPGGSRDVPMAMFVHGGYWRSMDRTLFAHLASGLLGHGVAVAMPSYDLCPQVTLAGLVGQVRDSAAFLFRRHGRAMLAIGHSAGGHLAAMLLATDWRANNLPTAIRAALPISGLFDLEPLRATDKQEQLKLDEVEARTLSPVHLPSPKLPIHAVVGGLEGVEYTRQASSIAEAWGGTWEAVPGANHFSIVGPLADPGSPLVATALRLIS